MHPVIWLGAGVLLWALSRPRQSRQSLASPAAQSVANRVRAIIRQGVREMQTDWAHTTGSVVESPPVPSTVPWEEGQFRRSDLDRLAGYLAEVGAPLPYSPAQLASPAVAGQALRELSELLSSSAPLRRGLAVLYAGRLL